MNIKPTAIEDLFLIEPKVYKDERGYFMEAFNDTAFKELFPKICFVQENESESTYGVLRGLHFQLPPCAQTKLVRVIKGEVLDVVVDLRKNSKTYGKYEKFILNDDKKAQLLIPRGFAHGFVTLSGSAIFSYKVDNHYSAEHDSGILWEDDELGIDWGVSHQDIKLSQKDKFLPKLRDFESPY